MKKRESFQQGIDKSRLQHSLQKIKTGLTLNKGGSTHESTQAV